MKDIASRATAGACLSLALLAGCSSGLNRSKEDQLNAQNGIIMLPVKGGVESQVSGSSGHMSENFVG